MRLLITVFMAFCTLIHTAHAEEAAPNKAELVLAGGCFWGVEAVFEHVKGVGDVVSGYAGGSAEGANYDAVSSGQTQHAEAVKISYDPTMISRERLLDVYFTVAHNPTQLNYQGPDKGPQYRSAIFYNDDSEKQAAQAKIQSVENAGQYDEPVVTTLEPLTVFYPAEEYHQDFAARNPAHPYIRRHDAPKVRALEAQFPDLFEPSREE